MKSDRLFKQLIWLYLILVIFEGALRKWVFMRDNQEAYSLRPWDMLGRHAVRVPSRVNTGLILARPEVLDLDFLEWLLGLRLPWFERFPSWAEHTCWAALGHRAGCRIWDPSHVPGAITGRRAFHQRSGFAAAFAGRIIISRSLAATGETAHSAVSGIRISGAGIL